MTFRPMDEQKSRTQKKNEARRLQLLGERLLKVAPQQLGGLDIPEELIRALNFARTIKSHGAYRRHLQYIGVLMRSIDHDAIEASLRILERGDERKARVFKEIETWRDKLIAGDRAVQETFVDRYGPTDRQRLAQLVRNAVREASAGKPPKAARVLFKYLREIVDT